jgi:mannosyl-3-phosphoglycerate phosphatase
VVYTDLDGTLLDHDSYSCEAARPALVELQDLHVPVVPVTSKTLGEVQHLLARRLHMRSPVIAENGGVIALPNGYFPVLHGYQPAQNYVVRQTAPSYEFITTVLGNIRQQHGFVFHGFNDMSNEEVAMLTGLSVEEAVRAKWRRCSEPLLWQDSATRLDEFRHLTETEGLSLTQGGRFLHVMGDIDKGAAIREMNKLFYRFGLPDISTLALGDSPNDLPMLQAADIAVVIRRKDGNYLQMDNFEPAVITEQPGPEGWNAFFQEFLQQPENFPCHTRTAHG